MTARKPNAKAMVLPPLPPTHLYITGNQIDIAIDLLAKIRAVRQRHENYSSMARLKDGPHAQTVVRLVDQETKREVYDVPASVLADRCLEEVKALDASLRKYCQMTVL